MKTNKNNKFILLSILPSHFSFLHSVNMYKTPIMYKKFCQTWRRQRWLRNIFSVNTFWSSTDHISKSRLYWGELYLSYKCHHHLYREFLVPLGFGLSFQGLPHQFKQSRNSYKVWEVFVKHWMNKCENKVISSKIICQIIQWSPPVKV